MRNTVRVRSSAFNTTEPRAHFINPCCFGDDLGAWLKPRLEAKGFRVSGPDQEDWGWYLVCARDGREAFVNIGSVDDADGEWLLGVEPYRSLADRLLGRGHGAESLARALHEVLEAAPEIAIVEWVRIDARGRESDASDRP
jgi:hypothetical protein